MMWKPLHLLLLSVPLAESFLIHSPCSASSKLVGCAGAAAVSAEATPETSTSSARTHDAYQQHVQPTGLSSSQKPRLTGGELLSRGVDGTSEVLGGLGRAKMVWSALAAGVDPWSEEGKALWLTEKTARVLEDTTECLPWKVVAESVSGCGTRKLLVRLEDGLEVETVVIPCLTGTRSTVCVSSQIGCAKACQFCMTGKMGLVRSLTAGEILGQVFFARQAVRQNNMPPLNNVVYMGMGEPLDNPAAVSRSLEVLTHPNAFAMAKAKISVSTVGPSPAAIKKMRNMPARLAWSVHAATDDVRRLLVPTTKHSMAELRDAFAEVLKGRGREHLFVEIVLIQGVNDSPELARALAALLRPLPTKSSINLLPLNDTGHPVFRASTRENVEEFRRVLMEEGFVATIRTARGDEESSACGQLATSAQRERRQRRNSRDGAAVADPARW